MPLPKKLEYEAYNPPAKDIFVIAGKINELITYLTELELQHSKTQARNEEAIRYLAGTADDTEDLMIPLRKFKDWHQKNIETILTEKE